MHLIILFLFSQHISVNNGLSRTSNPINVEEVSYILESIKKQGDRVRLFKTEKREKVFYLS